MTRFEPRWLRGRGNTNERSKERRFALKRRAIVAIFFFTVFALDNLPSQVMPPILSNDYIVGEWEIVVWGTVYTAATASSRIELQKPHLVTISTIFRDDGIILENGEPTGHWALAEGTVRKTDLSLDNAAVFDIVIVHSDQFVGTYRTENQESPEVTMLLVAQRSAP